MKPSSLVALICSLAINGINTFHQSAAAQPLPTHLHIAEALTSDNSDIAETDKFFVFQSGSKYGYDDGDGNEAIAAKFDNVFDFLK
jgi:hypothetical protein